CIARLYSMARPRTQTETNLTTTSTDSSATQGKTSRSLPEHALTSLASDYVALLVTSVSLRLSRSASGYYGRHWGIGTTEYRLVLGLGLNGCCNAMQLGSVADVDPGAVSRSLKGLKKEGFIKMVRQGREVQI